MKKLLILLFPLMMFAQDSTLTGDVDCSGEVNSQDASLILQFVTNVIDSLPCEANITGLTPDQLQEMIDMMDEQLSINYTAGSGVGCDFKFPEGLSGSIVTHNLEVSGDYTVENDKRLYIVNRYNSEFVIDGINVYKFDGIPLIVNQGETISVVQYSDSTGVYSDFNSFNGILVDQTEALEVFTSSMGSTGSFNVPEGKRFYLCGWYGSTPTVNGITIGLSETAPLILNSGDVLNSVSGDSHYNGYLVDQDYFADCSDGGVSTTNSSMSQTQNFVVDQSQYSFVLGPDTTDTFLFKFHITDSIISNSYIHGQVSIKLFNSSGYLINHTLESCMCLIPSTIPNTPYFDYIYQESYWPQYSNGIQDDIFEECKFFEEKPLEDGESYDVEITFISSLGFHLIKESFDYDFSLFENYYDDD